jgi:Lipocalin-like domain
MSKWILALALACVSVFSKAPAQSNKALVGTWKLESATLTTDKGEVRNSWGAPPIGFFTYTEGGRMSAILTLDDRKPLSVSDFISAPTNERAEAFATMTAYAGRYTFTGEEVTHHVEAASMPNDVGTDLKRLAKLDGDKLVLLVALALAIPIMIRGAGAFSVHGALAAKGQGI